MRRIVLPLAIAWLGCRADAPEPVSPGDAVSQDPVKRSTAPAESADEDPPVDHELEAAVASRLRVDPIVDAARIRVDAERGRVQLFGAVASRAQKQRAIAIAWIEGVTDVDASALTVSPLAARGAHLPPPAARNTGPDDPDVVEALPGEVVFGKD